MKSRRVGSAAFASATGSPSAEETRRSGMRKGMRRPRNRRRPLNSWRKIESQVQRVLRHDAAGFACPVPEVDSRSAVQSQLPRHRSAFGRAEIALFRIVEQSAIAGHDREAELAGRGGYDAICRIQFKLSGKEGR